MRADHDMSGELCLARKRSGQHGFILMKDNPDNNAELLFGFVGFTDPLRKQAVFPIFVQRDHFLRELFAHLGQL